MYRLFNGTIYISVIFAYVNNITNCWFSHDVTKIQTKKLSILPRFYFHDALEQLKTNFHTNFRFKRVLGFVKNQNRSIDKVQNLGNERRYIYKDPRQDSGQTDILYTRYPKKCFTQTCRDLYGDAMLVLTWMS